MSDKSDSSSNSDDSSSEDDTPIAVTRVQVVLLLCVYEMHLLLVLYQSSRYMQSVHFYVRVSRKSSLMTAVLAIIRRLEGPKEGGPSPAKIQDCYTALEGDAGIVGSSRML